MKCKHNIATAICARIRYRECLSLVFKNHIEVVIQYPEGAIANYSTHTNVRSLYYIASLGRCQINLLDPHLLKYTFDRMTLKWVCLAFSELIACGLLELLKLSWCEMHSCNCALLI